MVPKRFRGIPKDAIVRTIRFGAAARLSGGTVRWRFRENSSAQTRLAVIVPARVEPKATERNRIRRAVQAALLPTLPTIRPPRDIVVLWNAKRQRPDRTELRRAVEQAMRKGGNRHGQHR